jgi:hypothetical protein
MRHQILSMLCEVATTLGERDKYDALPQIAALKQLFTDPETIAPSKLAETMTTANFPLLMATTLSRKLFDQYQTKKGSWKDYTYPDTAPDFRDVERYRTTRPGTLYQRGEKGESEATSITESMIHYGVAEFSRQFDISWRVIVNDDLGFIRKTISEMVDAAVMFEDSFVSALYDNAVTQASMIAVGALYGGTGRLTAANLAIAINAFRQRLDAVGNPIMPAAIWLVIPPELELQTLTIMGSTQLPGVATNDVNVLPRFIQGYRVDPYIATAAPNVPWYLFAAPSATYPTVAVCRLEGWGDTPKLWMKAGDRLPMTAAGGLGPADPWAGSFATKDLEFEVEDIIGGWDSATWVGVTDNQGLYYSSGTTP